MMTTKQTAQEIWDIYADGVGGVNLQGKPLRKYDELGEQYKKGWEAVANSTAETAEELFDTYWTGVGGVNPIGKPLFDFPGLGNQKSGWVAVSKSRTN